MMHDVLNTMPKRFRPAATPLPERYCSQPLPAIDEAGATTLTAPVAASQPVPVIPRPQAMGRTKLSFKRRLTPATGSLLHGGRPVRRKARGVQYVSDSEDTVPLVASQDSTGCNTLPGEASSREPD